MDLAAQLCVSLILCHFWTWQLNCVSLILWYFWTWQLKCVWALFSDTSGLGSSTVYEPYSLILLNLAAKMCVSLILWYFWTWQLNCVSLILWYFWTWQLKCVWALFSDTSGLGSSTVYEPYSLILLNLAAQLRVSLFWSFWTRYVVQLWEPLIFSNNYGLHSLCRIPWYIWTW